MRAYKNKIERKANGRRQKRPNEITMSRQMSCMMTMNEVDIAW